MSSVGWGDATRVQMALSFEKHSACDAWQCGEKTSNDAWRKRVVKGGSIIQLE